MGIIFFMGRMPPDGKRQRNGLLIVDLITVNNSPMFMQGNKAAYRME